MPTLANARMPRPRPPRTSRFSHQLESARLYLVLMLALTFTTGMIDAIGFLGLDRVFTGNMTGNVAILGMAVSGADGLPVAGPAIALAGFMIGAVAAGRMLRGTTAGWTARVTGCLTAATLLTASVGVSLLHRSAGDGGAVDLTATALLAAAMGLQAGTARHLGVVDVTTVVITSTITALSWDSRLAGGAGTRWARRFVAIAFILLGALAGAALLTWSRTGALLVATTIMLVVTGLGELHRRRPTTGGIEARP